MFFEFLGQTTRTPSPPPANNRRVRPSFAGNIAFGAIDSTTVKPKSLIPPQSSNFLPDLEEAGLRPTQRPIIPTTQRPAQPQRAQQFPQFAQFPQTQQQRPQQPRFLNENKPTQQQFAQQPTRQPQFAQRQPTQQFAQQQPSAPRAQPPTQQFAQQQPTAPRTQQQPQRGKFLSNFAKFTIFAQFFIMLFRPHSH